MPGASRAGCHACAGIGEIASSQVERGHLQHIRTLCGYALTQTDFLVVDEEYLKMDGLLGHRFFAEYSVFVDLGAHEIYLKPCSEGDPNVRI